MEHPDEYAHQTDYAVYGWAKWSDNINQLPLHFVFRLTINEPEYQEDSVILGDRTLSCWLDKEGHF